MNKKVLMIVGGVIVGTCVLLTACFYALNWYIRNQELEPNGAMPTYVATPTMNATATPEANVEDKFVYQNEEAGFEITFPGEYETSLQEELDIEGEMEIVAYVFSNNFNPPQTDAVTDAVEIAVMIVPTSQRNSLTKPDNDYESWKLIDANNSEQYGDYLDNQLEVMINKPVTKYIYSGVGETTPIFEVFDTNKGYSVGIKHMYIREYTGGGDSAMAAGDTPELAAQQKAEYKQMMQETLDSIKIL